MKKSIDELTENDFIQYRVWRFVNDDSNGELVVSAIKKLPVKDLSGKVVFAPVQIANGNTMYAMIGNIQIQNPELTKHFMTISLYKDNRWFHLARYHDPDYSSHGPSSLANFLGLKECDIFPIAYDISFAVSKSSVALAGEYFALPEKRLTRAEVIALAVP